MLNYTLSCWLSNYYFLEKCYTVSASLDNAFGASEKAFDSFTNESKAQITTAYLFYAPGKGEGINSLLPAPSMQEIKVCSTNKSVFMLGACLT